MALKILILRFSSIGDIILTTPVMRCLKQQLPGVEIHYATKASFAFLVNSNPYIDKVHSLEKDLQALIGELKAEKFDEIIDLHNNLRTLIIKTKLGIPSNSFRKLNIEKWLLVNLRINRMPDIHIVDRYLETVQHLVVKNDGAGLDYFIPEKDETDPKSICGYEPGTYYALVIGAKFATKRMPLHKLISLCNDLNHPLVLLGGSEDAETAKKIMAAVGEHVKDQCGKLNFNQSVSMLKHSAVVITHDTGLMHAAAALRKPIVSVWGNTVPELGMYPYLPGNSPNKSRLLEVKGLNCRPCSKIGFDKCPKKHFACMEKIPDSAIIEAAESLWT